MAIENEIVVVKFIFCRDWENGIIVIALFLQPNHCKNEAIVVDKDFG